MGSLMVRRLAGGDADKPGERPHEMIARDVAAFLDATDRVGAYIAPASDHSVLGGAAITAARTPNGWMVDTATASGVHALRAASAEEANNAVLELAEKAHSGELFVDTAEASAWVCVVRYGSDARTCLPSTPVRSPALSTARGWKPGTPNSSELPSGDFSVRLVRPPQPPNVDAPLSNAQMMNTVRTTTITTTVSRPATTRSGLTPR
jgi:hypothetical protein